MQVVKLFCGVLFCVSIFCGSVHSAQVDEYGLDAVERAINDLIQSFPDEYTDGTKYLAEAGHLRSRIKNGDSLELIASAVADLKRRAMLSNPLLDFDELILVRRSGKNHGLINNWLVNSSIEKKGFDNEIALLSLKSRDAEIKTLYKPDRDVFVGDVDLHFDGDKMLFSMLDGNNSWQLWEVGIDGKGLKQVTPADEFKYDNFDGCYLPDGRVIFASTRMSHGVPCVTGSQEVANLFLLDRKNDAVRQLCYDQDQNWSPAVANNGRVMFTRWEYSDTPHYFSRLVMTMNPDGTDQKAYYGSNSYWPNSIFFARPIPNHPTKFVGIISGHHGVPRMGELVIFDPAIGRFEADGVVQRIPGFGKKVEPIIVDKLVDHSWPKFLHPYPLSDKYFLVSCKPDQQSLWGIYLVDIFDNMTLIKEQEGSFLFEPVPLCKTKTPPMIADRVDLTRDDSTVMITDIYEGPGLADVPRGTIKKLRIYELHYAYMQMGGHKHVAVEGCWDVRRILGTVDVNADGSASFTVPANMPHAIQCLDTDGAAVQVMQSWYTSMPGEIISCVGCHEDQNTTPPNKRTRAARKQPSKITPWYGPTRGFSFNREIQPVLDKYCIGCHNGQNQSRPDFGPKEKNGWGNFPEPYLALHPYVRRPGPESDYHLTNPYEYHTNTSELVQMLGKGHHGVKLDGESWDRIITWIDLNVPAHGTWGEHKQIDGDQCDMRIKMRTKYAGRDENPEKIFQTKTEPVKFVKPVESTKPKPLHTSCEDWPFDLDKAKQLQEQSSEEAFRSIDLGNGANIRMVRIPAGKFIMGSTNGPLDEMPASQVNIDKPFWMATTEITNQQFKYFDSSHDNGYFDQQHKDHTRPGYFAGEDKYPVMRVSWYEAVEFCKWLSDKSGLEVTLPSEAQWEWACRAGSDKAFSFSDPNSDFSKYANLADASLSKMAVSGVNPKPIKNPSPYDAFIPRITTVNDGSMLMDVVARYQPNAWGLYDMHGNVAEWTLSDYVSYPYSTSNKENSLKDKTARGGSWRDRPKRATSSFRLGYKPHQKVYNVGFRIIAADR